MSPLVRRFVKTAVAFLGLGLALGLALSAARNLGLFHAPASMVVAHTHLVLVGFVVMMIQGVALWMFPRAAPEGGRYSPERMEAVYWLMAVGTLARASAEVASGFAPASGVRAVAFAASGAQVAGIGIFFLTLWPRIRSPREHHERTGQV